MKASILAGDPGVLSKLAAIARIYQNQFPSSDPIFAPEDASPDKKVIEFKFRWAKHLPETDESTVAVEIELAQKYVVVTSFWRFRQLSCIHDAAEGRGAWFDASGDPIATPYPDGEELDQVGQQIWQLFFAST